MPFKFNPLSGDFDYYEQSIRNANATTYFAQSGNTVYLYVNGVVRQEWTTIPAGGGYPLGAWLFWTPIGQS